jgi:hypothetical protein
MTSLRRLSFDVFMKSLDDWTYITVVLDNITSSAITHIRFFLNIYKSAIPKQDLWTGIPPIIAKPDFRRLQKLEFHLGGGSTEIDEVEMWISRQFQSLEPLGILRVGQILEYI